MLRLATACMAIGIGSELVGFLAQSGAAVALFLGFVALTLSLILLILGLPSIRNLVR